MKNQISIKISLKGVNNNCNDFVLNIEKYLGFKPAFFISSNQKDYVNYEFKLLNKLLNTDYDDFIFEDLLKEQSFSYIKNTKFNLTSLTWIINSTNYLKINIESIIKYLNTKTSFVSCYIYDSLFVLIQSEDHIENLDMLGVSHKHLAKVKDDMWGEKIDLTKNYGRQTLVQNMWLMASSIMYYGNIFFDYVSKTKLLNYPSAKEIDTNLIKINLCEHVLNCDLERLKKFREWLKMDNLEKELTIKRDNNAEPTDLAKLLKDIKSILKE